jgi:hypothetical protein
MNMFVMKKPGGTCLPTLPFKGRAGVGTGFKGRKAEDRHAAGVMEEPHHHPAYPLEGEGTGDCPDTSTSAAVI